MDSAAIQQSDRVEFRDTLQTISRNVDDLKYIPDLESPTALEGLMQSIQEV